MSIYSLTAPTMMLLLNIAQLGIPTTVSKLISKNRFSKFKIMQVSFLILLVSDLLIGSIYILLVPTIANVFLNNSLTTLTLYGIVLLLPLVSMSSLLKGYFIGINHVEKTTTCQISEEIARIAFVIIFVDLINNENVSLLSFFAMFSTIVGEIASLIHLIISLKFNVKKNKKRLKINNENNSQIKKEILASSLPTISTRLIGSIIHFIEPIIYTYFMVKNGVDNETLTLQYGIINSYVFPLLLLPGFLSNALAMYILPKLSNSIENNYYSYSKKMFLLISFISLIFGGIFLTAIYLFPNFFLQILYGKILGIEYIKKYSYFLLLYYLQAPLHIAMICFNKEKYLFFESLICNIFKILCFIILIPKYQIDGLIISILVSVYISIFIDGFEVIKSFISLKNKSQFFIKKKT